MLHYIKVFEDKSSNKVAVFHNNKCVKQGNAQNCNWKNIAKQIEQDLLIRGEGAIVHEYHPAKFTSKGWVIEK